MAAKKVCISIYISTHTERESVCLPTHRLGAVVVGVLEVVAPAPRGDGNLVGIRLCRNFISIDCDWRGGGDKGRRRGRKGVGGFGMSGFHRKEGQAVSASPPFSLAMTNRKKCECVSDVYTVCVRYAPAG